MANEITFDNETELTGEDLDTYKRIWISENARLRLMESDMNVIRASEDGQTLSTAIKNYRNECRALMANPPIQNAVYTFDPESENPHQVAYDFPVKPDWNA
jgi:hypothetical protein